MQMEKRNCRRYKIENMDNLRTMTEETGKKMLNTLESIDATLKRIEQNQEETFKKAMSSVLYGNKYIKERGNTISLDT